MDLLKPHPKCSEYFSDPSPEEYEAVKRSIAAQGIRDPLKVAPDYTVVAGHLRLQIAKELGFEKVPVEIVDGDPEYLEYLLVADNEERRVCRDPIRKARRAEFLARYWGVRQGSLAKPGTPEGKFSPQVKTLADVAEAVGETQENLKKLLKLNNLIPPLQDLVSEGRLSQTAAYSLAFLPPEEQGELLRVLGESGVCGLSVSQARDLRTRLDAERKQAEELARRLSEAEEALARAGEDREEAARLKEEVSALRAENERLKSREPQVVERVVEKVVQVPVAAEVEKHKRRIRELEEEIKRLKESSQSASQLEDLEREVERLRAEKNLLDAELGRRRPSVFFAERIRKLVAALEKEEAEVASLAQQVDNVQQLYPFESRRWLAVFERYARYVRIAMHQDKIIDVPRGD